MAKRKGAIGGLFEDFLRDEGILEEVDARVRERLAGSSASRSAECLPQAMTEDSADERR